MFDSELSMSVYNGLQAQAKIKLATNTTDWERTHTINKATHTWHSFHPFTPAIFNLRLIVEMLVEVLLELGHVLRRINALVALQWSVEELFPGYRRHRHHHSPLLQAPDHVWRRLVSYSKILWQNNTISQGMENSYIQELTKMNVLECHNKWMKSCADFDDGLVTSDHTYWTTGSI